MLRGRVANVGVVVTRTRRRRTSRRASSSPATRTASPATRAAARHQPVPASFSALEPAVAASFRPAAGAYDVVFDTTGRRAAGRSRSASGSNDTTPPTVRRRRDGRAAGLLRRASPTAARASTPRRRGRGRRRLPHGRRSTPAASLVALGAARPRAAQARLHRLRLPGDEEQRERRRAILPNTRARCGVTVRRPLATSAAVVVLDRRQLVEVALDARGEVVACRSGAPAAATSVSPAPACVAPPTRAAR